MNTHIVPDSTNESELKKYNCACGKLLFKGLIFLSLVEVKCKRCGSICRFCDLYSEATGPYSFAFTTDKNGIITESTYSIGDILGHSPQSIIGKSLFDVCPKLKQQLEKESYSILRSAGKHFEIVKNHFAQNDGTLIPGKSYFISNHTNGAFTGYSIFNWMRP